MKAHPSPTSPRATKTSDGDLDQLYRRDLATIERPPKGRLLSSLWLLFFVLIISFFSSLVGLFLFFSVGPDVPFLGRLGLFSQNGQPSFVIGSLGRNRLVNPEQVAAIVQEVGPAVVSLYEKKEDPAPLGSLYVPGESRGSGLILTDDGYIVTTLDTAASADGLVVMTQEGTLYAVDSVITDPASDFAFLKIKGSGLATVGFANLESVPSTTDVLLVELDAPHRAPLVSKSSVVSPAYQLMETGQDSVQSSDRYAWKVLLNDDSSHFFDRAVAFTLDRKALGLVAVDGARTYAVPFDEVTSVLDQVLGIGELSRPSLGVRYLNVATTAGLPRELVGSLTEGALVYSDDEGERPSIIPGSPAQKAGLQKGDVITAINGQVINPDDELARLILSYRVGEVITLSITREGVQKSIKVTLEKLK